MSKKYAEINRKECIGCGACIRKCKKGALSMGPDGIPVVDKALCTGCGKCMKARPADCINIIKIKKDKDRAADKDKKDKKEKEDKKKEKKVKKEKKDKKKEKNKKAAQPEPEIREGVYLAPVYLSSYQRQMISASQCLDWQLAKC